MKYSALGTIALVACLGFQASSATAAEDTIEIPGIPLNPFTEDDLVLLQTDADGVRLSEALGGYSSRAGLFLPIGELARLLDLAIYVDPAERKATGWVVNKARAFAIDLQRNVALSDGQEIPLQRGDAILQNDEIYVRAELLQRILPIAINANLGDLALNIRTREQLPFKARIERMNRRPGGQLSSTPEAAELAQPYRFASVPSFDLSLTSEAGNRAPKSSRSYDLRLGGDLLYAGFQMFAVSDREGNLDNVRLLLERTDPSGRGLAGPFGLTRANIGDTIVSGLPLGPESAFGRGIYLSSESLEQASIFDRTDVRGELPAGYQVELYVNEVLRGSRNNAEDGRYAFTEVPLGYGKNLIRLVFYGPRGERREELRRITVDGNQLAAGKTSFSFGLVEEGRQVVEVNRVPEAIRLLLPGYGQPRVIARMAHGVGSGVTVNGGLAHFSPLTEGGRTLVSMGMVANIDGFSTQLDTAWDSTNAHAVAVGVAGRPAGISLVVRHVEYQGKFVDEVQPVGALADVSLRRSTSIRTDLAARFDGLTLPLALTLNRDETTDSRKYIRGSLRTSVPVGGYLLSTVVDAQQQSGGGQQSVTRIAGATDITGLLAGGWQLRAGGSYELLPTARLVSANATADRQLSDSFALRLGATHYFGERPTTVFQAGLTRRIGFALVTLNSSYITTNDDFRFGLQLSLAGLFDPVKRRYRLTSPGSGVGGNAAIRAFEDTNGNGQRDAGEAPVPSIKLNSASRAVVTDAEGHALAYGLGNGPTAILEADLGSVEDPYLKLDKARWQFVPRPGRVAIANYAFFRAGEAMLRTEFDSGTGNIRGLSALGLQLTDASGKVVFEGRSEFDGSLLAEGLAPGTYRISIDPEQAILLGITLEGNPSITIAAGGGYAGQTKVRITRASLKKVN